MFCSEVKIPSKLLQKQDVFETNMGKHQTEILSTRLGMSVTTQSGSGRQCVTGLGRNISKYRFVLLNMYRFRET